MKKICLLIAFLAVAFFSFSQSISGKWNFQSILPDTISTGENLKVISDGDAMQIKDDGSFHYEIAKENLIANGIWELAGKKLSFHYSLPKKITRTYQITADEKSLILNENGINFSFKKEKSIIVKTSGITLSSVFRGLLGLISLLLIAFLFSRNRKGIDWALVGKGLGIQMLFAILILKVSFVSTGFEFVGKIFTKVISFTQDGTMFLFKSFETGIIESPLVNFAIMILPTVIFFSALTSLFYYWGILPRIVYGFAWFMKRTMKLSGPESVAAAGNIFLGQTESPLLVKPYLNNMTMSEMMCLMSGGMATIAGGVLAAYIGFLGGDDPVQQLIFAKHLLAASVMSAPAAVVAAKIL
ncbi:MAG: Na+ dependent nucleoside transporter N-terminal domain-containing protein, partial [Bacteroidota bacterium]|nr:Na+ dependent nucleoside transporter N-terminal domain-containing protein [Bacteroidota bacterium]